MILSQRTRIWVGLLVFSLIFGVSLAGCNPSGTGQGGTVKGPGSPVSGGSFVIGRVEDTETLDPQGTTTLSSAEVMYLIYDTLLVRDYDMTIKPSLAQKWEIGDGGKTYTFQLRQGVYFHSGSELTAEDVKFTFERWLANTKSPSRFMISLIDRIETPDKYTVVVHLKEPFAIFLDNLTSSWASILNKSFVTAHEKDYGVLYVDGTGPYKFKEWVRNDHLTVVRNDKYAWAPKVFKNGTPYLEEVVFKVIPEDSTRLAELEQGNIQFTANLPPAEVDRLEKAKKVNLIRYSDLNTTFLGFKMGKKPLDDIRVRQAINYAINKDELIKGAYFGLAEPALGPIAPGTWGYWKDVEKAAYKYNPSQAKQLLEEAGWKTPDGAAIRQKDGQPLQILLMYSPGPAVENLMPIIQAQLKAVGIDVKLQQMEWTAYLAALRAGQHEMMLMSVRYTNADILYFYFHSKQRPAPNRFDYVDAKTDELLDISRTVTDDAKRLSAYQEIQKRVVESAVWVPLVHEKRAVAASPKVGGLRVHPAMVLYKMLDVYLAK
ncbi:MAG: ABC transporter substrate-binding protein [Firmicutes bacterium]|nr:ABC transporter substrate-binding protein [Bacillota bacterium]